MRRKATFLLLVEAGGETANALCGASCLRIDYATQRCEAAECVMRLPDDRYVFRSGVGAGVGAGGGCGTGVGTSLDGPLPGAMVIFSPVASSG